MNSTSFPAAVSPMMTGMQPRPFQNGGSTGFNLPNDIGQALYGAAPSPAQQQQVAQNAFLQGDAGGIPTTLAKGGTVKPKHSLTVVIPMMPPAGGALGRSMAGPTGHPLGDKAHEALTAVQDFVGMVSALPGINQQAVAAAKAHLRAGADLLLAAAQAAARGQR